MPKVIMIGAEPSSTIAATLLHRRSYQVTILERQHFPGVSIGENLLPQCMEFIK
jgi:monoamine oxidase